MNQPTMMTSLQQQQLHNGNRQIRPGSIGPQGPLGGIHHPTHGVRWFVALYDYDPLTMSPNPDGADEELAFREGDLIKVYGEKDADGFYRGESSDGRSGYVPCNMVSEVSGPDAVYAGVDGHIPPGAKKMIALYDYDPQENSPNPDADVSRCFIFISFFFFLYLLARRITCTGEKIVTNTGRVAKELMERRKKSVKQRETTSFAARK